jgi:hypothetical protein
MKSFWDDVRDIAISEFLESMNWPVAEIEDPKLAFTIIYSLTTLLHEIIDSRNGVLSDTGSFSHIHCLVCNYTFVRPTGHVRRNEDDPTFVPVDIVSILVMHGARLHAEDRGRTPFQALSHNFPYSQFANPFSSQIYNPGPLITELARQFLKIGQSPNVEVSKQLRKSYMLTETILCTPLHFVPPDLIELLLQFGANANAIDGRGRTPLDLACGVAGKVEEIGGSVDPLDAYETAALLLRHGVKLRKPGWKQWRQFVHLLQARGGISIPHSFRGPPKMSVFSRSTIRNRLALAMKGNKPQSH